MPTVDEYREWAEHVREFPAGWLESGQTISEMLYGIAINIVDLAEQIEALRDSVGSGAPDGGNDG